VCRSLLVVALSVAAAGWAGPAHARERWVEPVPGVPLRGFSYSANPFAAGLHRGADLAVRRGEPVRSACAGRVVFAGRVVDQGGVVSVRCGPWRASYVGLAAIAVRAGELVPVGHRLGAAGRASGHAGLHFGVRREGRRFGYVDPLAFLAGSGPSPPPPAVVPVSRTPTAPAARPLPAAHARPQRASAALAPWPVWLGLGLLLAGLAGAGTVRRPSRREELQPCPASSTSSSPPTTPTVRR
jgi:hypothetical protein